MRRKRVFYTLLFFYFLIAVANVGYNLINTSAEIKNWYFLTDTQKREKIFGDLYTFFIFIDTHTPSNAHILIVSPDVRTFYLGRYYLYPKNVTVVSSPQEIRKKLLSEYIASYGKQVIFENYDLIKTITLLQTKQKGYLYKKQ